MTHHEQKVMLRDQRISKKKSRQGESFATPARSVAGEINLHWIYIETVLLGSWESWAGVSFAMGDPDS